MFPHTEPKHDADLYGEMIDPEDYSLVPKAAAVKQEEAMVRGNMCWISSWEHACGAGLILHAWSMGNMHGHGVHHISGEPRYIHRR